MCHGSKYNVECLIGDFILFSPPPFFFSQYCSQLKKRKEKGQEKALCSAISLQELPLSYPIAIITGCWAAPACSNGDTTKAAAVGPNPAPVNALLRGEICFPLKTNLLSHVPPQFFTFLLAFPNYSMLSGRVTFSIAVH